MFKFIHAADIHLDSPLKGLEVYEGAPVQEIRTATRRAFEGMIELALDERVDFVIIAGDVYDGDWRDYNTGLFFVRQATRLLEADIPLFLLAGNHDAANRMTRSLKLPENVTRLRHESPQTVTLEDLGVAIHGQSFAQAATFDDLSASYPTALSGMFNIGVLHTSATGYEGHDAYAPCTVEGLSHKNYDYWALGHVHKRETLCNDPPIGFCGNLQGRHIRETGAKGCLLARVEDDLSVQSEFRPLDVMRWERAAVDVTDARGTDEVLSRVATSLRECHQRAEGRPLATRVELEGVSHVQPQLLADRSRWTNEIRSQALAAGGGEIWIEKVEMRVRPPAAARKAHEMTDGPLGELVALVGELRADPAKLQDLGVDFTDIARKLPAEVQGCLRIDDPAWLRAILDEAEPRLFSQLLGKVAQ